jgi:hypothetical protein
VKLMAILAVFLSPICIMAGNSAPASEPLTISAADQARLGVSTIQLTSQQEREGVFAVVRAVDPAALFALAADFQSATAAATASGDELARLESLARNDNSASRKSVQATRQTAEADAARLTLVKRRIAVEWGVSFRSMMTDGFGELADAIARGEAALVRADCPEQPAGVRGDIEFALAPEIAPVTATPLGLSGSADARLQTIGLFGVVKGEAAQQVRPGRLFSGEIKTSKILSGVVIPRSAILRIAGDSFAYVKTGDTTFERRPISNATVISDGWYVSEGFSSGDTIVTSGAGSMLAVERGDESAESD